ncbi:MAG: class I SAM-dependent methyltransferase [Candidatus Sungbacteria bacterium]|uniref:Class I SAM-dependent methyltransferase n=1 Tax=Candidatus Sungiibacteriota bacterium TaxID=2750080 RepID=A0A9D6QS05_9BACT|nr:class I SAM-dependent methyltransferase [Candidatus Sungbacteria bacterium]
MQDPSSFLNPERVVSYFDIAKGSIVADFGAGAGYYTIPLARKVGPEGKVYAFDIQPHSADLVRSKARMHHILQVEALTADLERNHGTHLKDAVVDFILCSSVLHQAEDKLAVLHEAARILKPGRLLAVIEWDLIPAPGGPKPEFRIAKARARELCESSGFMLDREFEAGTHHYGLLFKKR